MNSLEQDRAALAAQERNAREGQALYQFFKKHPELDMQANENLLRQHHHGEEITLETLEESAAYLGDRIASKSYEAVERAKQHEAERVEESRKQEKGRLVAEIAGRLKGAGVSALAIEGEIRNRYAHMNNAELQAKIDSLDEAARLRSMTHSELRKEARANHAQPQAPDLPAEYIPQRIKAMTAPELRKLMERYGANKVNERLGVQPARKPGISFGVKL